MTPVRPPHRRGVYESVYWDYAAGHEFRLQRCTRCGHVRYPAGPACPQCLSADAHWDLVQGAGTVVSWIVMRRQYFPYLPVPYTVVAVELNEGPLVVGNLVGDGEVRTGAAVTAEFADVEDPSGTPYTLVQWRLADEADEANNTDGGVRA